MQTNPKQVLRIQIQPREQLVEVPIVLHFEQLVEKSTVVTAEAVVQVHRVNVRHRMFLKSWRRSVKLWDRSQERDYGALLNKLCTTKSPDPGADCERLW